MSNNKLLAGSIFPEILVKSSKGKDYLLSTLSIETTWKMVVVYRGVHCPICTTYLNQLEQIKNDLTELGVSLVAVSADSKAQVTQHQNELNISYDLCYDLSIEQMQKLGLYISKPRSEKETDHPFAEPGVFIINEKGQVQIVDISNAPFMRPSLESIINGIRFIRNPDNNYPIRGTY